MASVGDRFMKYIPHILDLYLANRVPIPADYV